MLSDFVLQIIPDKDAYSLVSSWAELGEMRLGVPELGIEGETGGEEERKVKRGEDSRW